jgi:hypothetical protein
LVAATLAAPRAFAVEPMQPKEDGDVRFVSGGVGQQERRELLEQKGDYDLRVTVAREADGAYLAGVDIALESDDSETVLDTKMLGPIFLAELPGDAYVLTATLAGWTTERRRIDLSSGPQDVHITMTSMAPSADQPLATGDSE